MDPLDEALENLQSASLGLTSLLNGCMDDDLPGEEVSSALAAQEELQRLTETFQTLGRENVLLRNKLKVLERVVPHRDENAGVVAQLLAAAKAQARAQQAASGAASSESAGARGGVAAAGSPERHSGRSPGVSASCVATSSGGFEGGGGGGAGYTNVDTGKPERPSETFWVNCARSLALTPQQLADVNSLAAVYELDVLPVVQQRLQLSEQLTSSLAASGATAPAASCGQALTALSSVDELARQLERSVLREHRSHWAIGDFLCSSVLTPLQIAKALTVSYPYIPDGVAMMHAFKQLSVAAATAATPANGGPTKPAPLAPPTAAVALCPEPDGDVPALTAAAVEQVKRTTPAEFQALWNHICQQMGILVSSANVHGPGSLPHVRLERYVERVLSYVDKVKVLAPVCFVQSMYINVCSGEHDRPNNTFWTTCARSLNLTPQQLSEAASLADLHSETVTPTVQQRIELAAQLQANLAAARRPPASCGEALAAIHAVDDIALQLERCVMREHQAHWDITDYLCSSVLTPPQVAKAIVAAYPYVPDGVAMLHAFKQLNADAAAAAARIAPVPASGAGAAPVNPLLLANIAGLLAGNFPALAGIAANAGCVARPAANPATAGAALAGLVASLQAAQRKPPGPVAPTAAPQPAFLSSILAGIQAARMIGRAAA
ncbi:hypothetical protein GPECTOR_3g214 [Gonium pectorale]|uniref:Uncharacterized protein n=1 Tax=Gonium pectorale TaxID=33097 RepID=A0A150GYS3_GONPE|nr:hypothetical protein GPECTOR_3g214 [Gonium pectorale]|eukprot:KXZ55056.1 hypothetical protein GPECTOR_3g214 [Gonium pectorale]